MYNYKLAICVNYRTILFLIDKIWTNNPKNAFIQLIELLMPRVT